MTHLVIVGVPGDRRTDAMAAALRQVHIGPTLVPWVDVVAGTVDPAIWHQADAVRIESPGEHAASRAAVLRAGGAPERLTREPTSVAGSRAWYRGLCAAVKAIAASVDDAPVEPSPEAIAVLCDKARCHARLLAAGIPVPGALTGPMRGWDDVRAGMAERGWSKAFVKPRHGSSAAGLVAVTMGAGRTEAWSPAEVVHDTGGLVVHGSLRVHRFRGETEVGALVDHLGPDGMHVEQWFPKLGLADGNVDLRVVVTGGRPSHVVARRGRGPFTNLHLGGGRADVAEVRRSIGDRLWMQAMDTASRVAEVFPGTAHVGVDVMFSADRRRHAVAEANAFGDLLPGVVDTNGRSTYEGQAALLATVGSTT